MKTEEEEEKDNSKLFLTLMEGYSDSTIPLLSEIKTEAATTTTTTTTTAIKEETQNQSKKLELQLMKACASRKRPVSEEEPSSKPSMEEFHKEKQRRELYLKKHDFQLNKACDSRKRPNSSEEPSSMDIHKEKQRRDKMSTLYSVLQSMVPNIPFKATREKIVGETINHIKELEEVLKEAQKKASMANLRQPREPSYSDFITLKNSTINVVVSGKIVFFGINSEIDQNQRFLFNKVMGVFEKCSTEILTTTVSVNEMKKMSLTVTALVNGNGGGGGGGGRKGIEDIKQDLIRLLCSRN